MNRQGHRNDTLSPKAEATIVALNHSFERHIMRNKSTKAGAAHAAPAAVQQSPPDPVDIIAQHWADLTGWSRPRARDQLVQIGHATMKENRAAVNTLRKEIEDAADARSQAALAKREE